MEANNNELKNLAKAAAEGTPMPQPEAQPQSSALEDLAQNLTQVSAPAQVAKVGDPDVVIAPPIKQQATPPMSSDAMALKDQLMHTPSPNAPEPIKPTSVGLDDEALSTPNVSSKEESPSVGNFEDLKYNEDQTFSAGQLTLMEEHLVGVPVTDRQAIADPIFQSVDSELRKLITVMHFGVDEAQSIVYQQVIKKLDDEAELYKNSHPEKADIVLDKSQDPNDLQLTQAEHEKLERVRRVRLILMEDEDLKNITIERPDERHKADYVKSIEGSISKYQVPLPMMGDFVAFKGAQIVQMINMVNYEDSTIDETINKKASLIYDKLISGSILRRFDANGKSKMSYDEFINLFPYQDIDLALYGILCASMMEESSTSLTCEKCRHTWNQTYNIKSLLNLKSLSDYYKQRVENILANKTNDLELMKLHQDRRRARRYKSPFTGNIYDVSYPTVARAINLLKRIDENDPVMTYNSAVALYLSRVLVYNKEKDTYVEVTAEETELLLDTVLTLTNEDMNMLANQIREDLFYSPQFTLTVECPSCHNKTELPLTIENLIFLKAQDSMVEIES